MSHTCTPSKGAKHSCSDRRMVPGPVAVRGAVPSDVRFLTLLFAFAGMLRILLEIAHHLADGLLRDEAAEEVHAVADTSLLHLRCRHGGIHCPQTV